MHISRNSFWFKFPAPFVISPIIFHLMTFFFSRMLPSDNLMAISSSDKTNLFVETFASNFTLNNSGVFLNSLPSREFFLHKSEINSCDFMLFLSLIREKICCGSGFSHWKNCYSELTFILIIHFTSFKIITFPSY